MRESLLLLLVVLGSMFFWCSSAVTLMQGSQLMIPSSSGPAASALQRRTLVKTSCSLKQRVAHDVLTFIANGPQQVPLQQRQQRQQRPRHSRRRYHHADNDDLTMISSSSSSSASLPLHQFVHHLPSPQPTKAWWQLCRAVEASGLAGLKAALAPGKALLPDVQGAAAAHCELARHPWAHTFKQPALSAFVAALFLHIVRGRAAAAGQLKAPAPQLSRFDLFHGHLFLAYDCSPLGLATGSDASQRITSSAGHTGSSASNSSNNRSSTGGVSVGILFHAAEYPAHTAKFPVPLGFCQANSSLKFHQRSMDLRNILWWKGQLAVLDVGRQSPLNQLLLHEGTRPLRTTYEEDFGQPVADLLLLRQPPPRRRRSRSLAAEQVQWLRELLANDDKHADGVGAAAQALLDDLAQGVFVSY